MEDEKIKKGTRVSIARGKADGVVFYGFNVSDWFDEAPYTVCFREPPDEAALEIIAESLRTTDIPLAWRNHWLWSGRLLCFSATARGRGAVRKWANALHAKVPIVDVTFEGFREGDTETTTPEPGPRSKRLAISTRPFDDALPEWAQSPGFEATLQRLARKATRQHAGPALDKLLAKQKKRAPIQFERVDDLPAPSVGEERFDLFNVPHAPTVLFEHNYEGAEEQLAPGDHPILSIGPRAAAWVVREAKKSGSLRETFAYAWEGERREANLPPGLDCRSLTFHPGEPRALVVASTFIFEVDLPSGEATLRTRVGSAPWQAVYLADGHWAVLTGGAVVVLDADDQVVCGERCYARQGHTFAEGRGLVTGPEPLLLHAFARSQLTPIAELEKCRFVRVQSIQGDPVIELAGGTVVARNACEHIASLQNETGRKAKASRKKKPEKELPPLRPSVHRFESFEGELPPPPARSPLPAAVEGATASAQSPSAQWIAFRKAGDPWLYVYQAQTGSIQRADYDPAFFAIRDDGTLVAFSAAGARWRRPPEPGHDESREWPGVVLKLDRRYRCAYLHGHDLLVLHHPNGSLLVLGCDGTQIIQRWWDVRGVERIAELDGDLVLDGAIGRWRLLRLRRARAAASLGSARSSEPRARACSTRAPGREKL